MKRIAILLVIVLLTGTVGGCQYVIVEGEPMRVAGLSAMAEGWDLFSVENPDTSFLSDEPENLTPSPSPTPKRDDDDDEPQTPTPKPTAAVTPVPTKMPKVRVTPEPTPTATPYVPVLIGLHSRDDVGENKVQKLQARLVELGYLEGEPDGVFGSRTLRALQQFQKDNNLEETGVLDDETKLALYPRPEVTTAPKDVLYAQGAQGRDVRVIRRRLRQYGFSVRPESSQFDEETVEEIMAFQSYAVQYYGTEFDDPAPVETGVDGDAAPSHTDIPATEAPTEAPSDVTTTDVDVFGIPEMPVLAPEATLRPYHATDGVVTENLNNYMLEDRFPVYRETVQRGDTGVEVERLQRRLTTLDYFYNDVTGEYDEYTDAALEAFQHRNGLQETGIADAETQALLYSPGALMAEQVEQPFYIKVSISEQRVYVYRWLDDWYDQPIKSMICSSGLGNSTPKGVFVSTGHRDGRWHYFIEFNCWAQYAFVITGNILFHSVIYSSNDVDALRYSTVANLGHKASHGCVRLRVEDAKWIYEHCGAGQVIEVY